MTRSGSPRRASSAAREKRAMCSEWMPSPFHCSASSRRRLASRVRKRSPTVKAMARLAALAYLLVMVLGRHLLEGLVAIAALAGVDISGWAWFWWLVLCRQVGLSVE